MTDTRAPTRDAAARLVGELQERICERVLTVERTIANHGGASPAQFRIDAWHSDGAPSAVSGNGSTRVIADGAAFEKGGVNTSVVTAAALPPSVVAQRPELAGHGFFAAGVSVVMHPRNPNAPTAHCNYRYFARSAKPSG